MNAMLCYISTERLIKWLIKKVGGFLKRVRGRGVILNWEGENEWRGMLHEGTTMS